MTGSIALIVVASSIVIDLLVTLAALHPRFNPRRAFRQRAESFRIAARGRAHNPTHNGCNAA